MTQKLENLQALVEVQGKQIETYKKLVDVQDERIKELKSDYANARWIAIFEFVFLFTSTEGEIANLRYFQTAFENIGIKLDEQGITELFEFAKNRFKYDEEYTRQMQAKQQENPTP